MSDLNGTNENRGMNTKASREAEARRKAQALWEKDKQRGQEVLAARTKARDADAAKTARLRDLRLAKEAADKLTPPKVEPRKRAADAAPAKAAKAAKR
jgi:hypothetical protein